MVSNISGCPKLREPYKLGQEDEKTGIKLTNNLLDDQGT